MCWNAINRAELWRPFDIGISIKIDAMESFDDRHGEKRFGDSELDEVKVFSSKKNGGELANPPEVGRLEILPLKTGRNGACRICHIGRFISHINHGPKSRGKNVTNNCGLRGVTEKYAHLASNHLLSAGRAISL